MNLELKKAIDQISKDKGASVLLLYYTICTLKETLWLV